MIEVRVIGNSTHYTVNGQLVVEPLPDSVKMLISDNKPEKSANEAQLRQLSRIEAECEECG